MFFNQIRNSKYRGHTAPSYTREELETWVTSQPQFKKLYDKWKKEGHSKKLTPSCDRLDDYRPYTLCNLQLVTWEENNTRSHRDAVAGINLKRARSVNQLTLDGEFIKEFPSIAIAARETKSPRGNLSSCLTGKRRKAGGFKWEYAD